ncbi:hypothetical protein HG15A2_04570 [Adhaeretor mobilis]|uniref:Uncharacterized protein n=2 Tax=Adhaeretor mobilis TaxID=1930276 RepID=A0A517MQZ0_9BACT|nr:hypothetical protein HG15A2_04570 [Adhaeretor mobilis]
MTNQGQGLIVNFVKLEQEALSRYPAARRNWGRVTDTGEGAWRVGYCDGSETRYLPMVFARKQDANSARDAIEKELDWSGSYSEMVKKAQRYGLAKIRKVMLEALAW